MGSCYIDDHTAGEHIHRDITPCNTKEPQQSAVLERSVKDYLFRPVPSRLQERQKEEEKG